MRIITTFNDALYRASAKALLESVHALLPDAEILVYEELEQESCDEPSVRVDELPEFQAVLEANRDIIPEEMGGTARGLEGYNRRWLGWFRKIVMQHDALTRRPHDGYTILLDTDARIVRPFTEELIRATVAKPIGVFKGGRDSIEAGVIFFDERSEQTADFARLFMDLFLSGEFRRLERWDDGFAMEHCRQLMPRVVHDLAEGREPIEHTNSNGHSTGGHVLPQTVWGRYIEHDKGIHWRRGVVPTFNPAARTPPHFLRRVMRRLRGLPG